MHRRRTIKKRLKNSDMITSVSITKNSSALYNNDKNKPSVIVLNVMAIGLMLSQSLKIKKKLQHEMYVFFSKSETKQIISTFLHVYFQIPVAVVGLRLGFCSLDLSFQLTISNKHVDNPHRVLRSATTRDL